MPKPIKEAKTSNETTDKYRTKAKPPLPKCTVIHGQTGSGKTTTAASSQEGVATHLAKGSTEALTLKGVVWLSCDEDALVALAVRGIHPEYELDFRNMLDDHRDPKTKEGNVGMVLREIHTALDELAEVGANVLVWDTATTLGEFLEGWFVYGSGVPESERGRPNTMRGWGIVGDEYRKIYEVAAVNGYRQIILCHPKSNKLEEEAAKGDAAAKAKAVVAAAPGDNLIYPAVSGAKFGRFLRGACSLEAWLVAEDTQKGGTKIRSRVLMPMGGQGAQGKSRYEGILGQEEPADLFAIDKKILAAAGKSC